MKQSKLLSILDFAYKKRTKWFLIPVFFLLLIWIKPMLESMNILWKDNLDIVAAVATLIVTMFLAVGELTHDWEAQLPKKLTVIFTFEGLPVMKCEEVWLAGESDIRQWSQQIGRQMAGGTENLDFEPFVMQKEAVVQGENEIFKLYTTTFTLTRVPTKFKDTYLQAYIYWSRDKATNRIKATTIKQTTA